MAPSAVVVRDVQEADLPAILAIYNDVIATSTAVYRDEPVTLENRAEWWRSHVEAGFPVLVGADGSGVLGFATFGEFRAAPGYRFTIEHSVHVRVDRRGQGVGRALMIALIEGATGMGMHAMVGGVDAANLASIRFHESLGFQQAAYLREVGTKFGRWLDLVFMERILIP